MNRFLYGSAVKCHFLYSSINRFEIIIASKWLRFCISLATTNQLCSNCLSACQNEANEFKSALALIDTRVDFYQLNRHRVTCTAKSHKKDEAYCTLCINCKTASNLFFDGAMKRKQSLSVDNVPSKKTNKTNVLEEKKHPRSDLTAFIRSFVCCNSRNALCSNDSPTTDAFYGIRTSERERQKRYN